MIPNIAFLAHSHTQGSVFFASRVVPGYLGDHFVSVCLLFCLLDRRDGVVVRASASQSVDQGFIPLVESYQKTLKMASTASLLGVRHLRKVVENKPASSLVVSLGKALNGTPLPYVEDRWLINLEKGNSQASADLPSKI